MTACCIQIAKVIKLDMFIMKSSLTRCSFIKKTSASFASAFLALTGTSSLYANIVKRQTPLPSLDCHKEGMSEEQLNSQAFRATILKTPLK
jgi:hypothetical protein